MATALTLNWDLVERFYPNYYTCPIILHNNRMKTLVDGERDFDGYDAKWGLTHENLQERYDENTDIIMNRTLNSMMDVLRSQIVNGDVNVDDVAKLMK